MAGLDLRKAKIKCPSCGSSNIVEVLTGVMVINEIEPIVEVGEDSIYLDYKPCPDLFHGQVEVYECGDCNMELGSDVEDLLEYIKYEEENG